MECRGKLKGVSKDWVTGSWELSFEIQEDITGAIDGIKEKMLSITAKIYHKRRSLDANAYYWQLITKLSEAVGISKDRAHNIILGRYGQLERYDGHLVYVVIPDTPEGAERAMEADTYHIKPTAEVQEGADGIMFRTYKMLRGSSTYDTEEMAALIDGLVSECRQLGIETMTPDQIAEMMAAYERNRRGP